MAVCVVCVVQFLRGLVQVLFGLSRSFLRVVVGICAVELLPFWRAVVQILRLWQAVFARLLPRSWLEAWS